MLKPSVQVRLPLPRYRYHGAKSQCLCGTDVAWLLSLHFTSVSMSMTASMSVSMVHLCISPIHVKYTSILVCEPTASARCRRFDAGTYACLHVVSLPTSRQSETFITLLLARSVLLSIAGGMIHHFRVTGTRFRRAVPCNTSAAGHGVNSCIWLGRRPAVFVS